MKSCTLPPTVTPRERATRVSPLRSRVARLGAIGLLVTACGGSVAEEATPTTTPPRDAQACALSDSPVRLVPAESNEAACTKAVVCNVTTGHGAYWVRCPEGVGSGSTIDTDECDKSACRCTNGAGFVVDFSAGTAYGKNAARTCTYRVERTP